MLDPMALFLNPSQLLLVENQEQHCGQKFHFLSSVRNSSTSMYTSVRAGYVYSIDAGSGCLA